MASVNKVIIIGHLGKDPETRYAQSGDAICNLTIATSETWKDKATGEKKEQAEWHRVVMFQKLAEIAAQYLRKGSLVYLEGRLQTRKWTDKDGTDRYTTEIRCDEMKMLGGKSDGASAPQELRKESAKPQQPASHQSGGGFGDFSDDVPF